MKRFLGVSLIVLVVGVAGSQLAFAQQAVEHSGSVSKTATITAIDHKTRVVTLKDSDGNLEDVEVGPEVTRFDELKVGDTVTFSYHAAVVLQLAKPGAAMSASSEVSTVRGQGARPSGAITHQRKATVTITALDPAAGTVTVKTADGHTISGEVQDKKNLEGVKVGDKVDITFTEALMVTVESAKK
jgi:Cu/Ag efflux protein CusF